MRVIFFIVSHLWLMNAMAADIMIADFATEDIKQWQVKKFSGVTHYQVMQLGNKSVLRAVSQSAASGIGKKMKIDLNKTPYLNWSWRVDKTYPGLNEQSKAGDDYPARVYVVIGGGLMFWRTKALNYVWSSNQSQGHYWTSPFTNNAKMLAVRGKQSRLKHWFHEKQNIKVDFKRLFGKDLRYIDGVALMTDSDNAKGQALSYYGNIYFSAE